MNERETEGKLLELCTKLDLELNQAERTLKEIERTAVIAYDQHHSNPSNEIYLRYLSKVEKASQFAMGVVKLAAVQVKLP